MTFAFDRRVRSVDDLSPVGAREFHAEVLPRLLDERGDLAARALRAAPLDALTIGVGADAWTWRLDGAGDLEVVEGDHGDAPRADLDAAWFSDLVNEVVTSVSIMIADLPVMTRGRIGHLIGWEPTLRALMEGRQPYEDGAVSFTDRSGDPLDLGRSFGLDDDDDELAHFLGEAGFLHVRGVFDRAEMDALSAEMDRWFARMSPDDERSWYATADGEERCVRVTNLPRDAVDFPHEARLAPIAAITGDERHYTGSDLLVKPLGVSAGLSDLPWHKDCELGQHSYRCASLTMGVSVTPSGADNGQLGVIAGSHRVNVTMFDLDRIDLPRVFLSTEPGDVTVHLSCALHCATPPEHTERRVTYSSFRLAGDTSGLDALDARRKEIRDQAGRETYAPR